MTFGIEITKGLNGKEFFQKMLICNSDLFRTFPDVVSTLSGILQDKNHLPVVFNSLVFSVFKLKAASMLEECYFLFHFQPIRMLMQER